ncbi:MAG: amidohydrolase family protein [Rhodospirillaceae bacterium]|jgi:cytosine/creatinine deaminase|nr:amidohydrolase family protein [Rhodospirillaceae bacterium]MBT5243611.1 amidohydrolase family protein [Rhodospirillaceae bacterium]MBT5562199.1 amidohydrolase family protein [Rhodospirillaceae bacterium]MBT6242372.1 amidohydrolase family protein [Rhodospirillaceae bacterium]MBT7138922.1 amidohydrolase family protein [Rhodospirillaceae bacterium]
MFDLIVRNARLATHDNLVDIAIKDAKIADIGANLSGEAGQQIDAAGHLVSPPFVDAHFHMDATLTYGQPRVNASGTLLEGIALWAELKPTLSVEEIKARALRFCRWSIARGTLAIRSHVDISDSRLLAVEALLEVRKEIKPWLDLQLVAFPQDGFLRLPTARDNLLKALDMGVDVVGGIPHFERTMADGAQSVTELCEIAAERGLLVDMHCDESDDPMSRHIETLARETQRLGLNGRVSGSHLTSMHSMDNYYVSKLMPLMLEADIHAIANPLINITLQGRHDSYPKRRGMTRVKELMEFGINVAMGHDCVMDPWYSLGSHDMLDVAHMGLHVAQMTGLSQMNAAYDAVTKNAARAMCLDGYGLEIGCHGDMVILQCHDPVEALRLRPARLFVIRRGQVIARTEASEPVVTLGNGDETVSFSL